MKLVFEYTIFIANPSKDVWNALIQKELVDRYFLAPLVTLELEKGGKIAYGTMDSELISGTITEIDEPQKLAHTFHFAGSGDPDTAVCYEIEAIGDWMCALHLTHSGFIGENQTYVNISGGWPVIASSLKTLLETGKPLPWPE
ncbi:MAG: SRPBCC domain-containing protein [Verrucomicrobiota bacterium]